MSTDALYAGPPEDPARYRVEVSDLDQVAAGGEGLVYRARRTLTGETVALKVLTNTPLADFPRLAERASLLEGVRHPNLLEQIETFLGCPLGDGTADDAADFDVPYSVAAWIDGKPLTDAADDATIDQKLRWIAELAAALDHLHNHRTHDALDGLVHRDVKPSNVRIRHDGTAVLLDFGVARPVDGTDMTQGIGTFMWRAPEVLSSRTDSIGKPADVWGLGAVAHWLIVSEPPPLDGAEAARERLAAALEQTEHRSAGPISRNLACLLESNPARRPTRIAEWSRTIRRRPRRQLRRAAIAALAVTALAGIVAFLLAPATLSVPSPASTPRTEAPSERLECTGEGQGHVSIEPPINSEVMLPVVVALTEPSAWIRCKAVVSTGLGEAETASRSVRLDALNVGPTGEVDWEDLIFSGSTLTGSASITWDDGDTASATVNVRILPESNLEGEISLQVRGGKYAGYHGSASFRVLPEDTDRNLNGEISGRQVLLTSLALSQD